MQKGLKAKKVCPNSISTFAKKSDIVAELKSVRTSKLVSIRKDTFKDFTISEAASS